MNRLGEMREDNYDVELEIQGEIVKAHRLRVVQCRHEKSCLMALKYVLGVLSLLKLILKYLSGNPGVNKSTFLKN